jgi:lysozyme family protein
MALKDDCITLILRLEGGSTYTNDPKDPGGETKYGISRRAYPELDIANLTEQQARDIYARDYWAACKCAELPPSVALCVFDAAVNQGAAYARRTLQEALNVAVDGKIGPATINKAAIDPSGTVIKFQTARIKRYQNTKGYDRFGLGWIMRVMQITFAAARL